MGGWGGGVEDTNGRGEGGIIKVKRIVEKARRRREKGKKERILNRFQQSLTS